MQREGRRVVAGERGRWQYNREMYLGNPWLQAAPNVTSVRTMASASMVGQGRHRDTINRLRQFTDGRVSTLTYEKPAGEVIPVNYDQDSVDGARMGTKLY